MRKVFCLLLVWLIVVQAGGVPGFAKSREDAREERAEMVRVAISRIGFGEDARVQISLYDKAFLSGYVVAAGEDSFVVKNETLGKQTRIVYEDVAELRADNATSGIALRIPGEKPRVIRAALKVVKMATRGQRGTETTSNNLSPKVVVVTLAVLAVVFILIGVELKKS